MWDEQIFIRNGADLSFVTISSEDDEVTIDRASITTNPTAENLKPILYGEGLGTKLPKWNILASYNTAGVADGQSGIWVEAGAEMYASGFSGSLSQTPNTVTANGVIYQ